MLGKFHNFSALEEEKAHTITSKGGQFKFQYRGSYLRSIVAGKMTLFILTETSAGYALLKAKDKKLLKRDDLAAETETAEGICSL